MLSQQLLNQTQHEHYFTVLFGQFSREQDEYKTLLEDGTLSPNANPYAIEINETLDAVQVQLETEIAEANAWTVAAEDQCTRVSVRARAGSKWNVVRVEMRAPMPCGVGFVLNRFLLNAENQMK